MGCLSSMVHGPLRYTVPNNLRWYQTSPAFQQFQKR